MKAPGRVRIFLRLGIPLVTAAIAVAGHPAPSWGQAACDPACPPNQTCVQGTCMVPAQPPAPPPPPPAYAPPPAYPPPPAGYQTAPPPNYPPPQGNVYAPPTQGYPPPQQGGYYPPPPPQGLDQRRGFLAMPYLGFNSRQGDTGEGLDAGFRLGVLLGGHINEHISLNGELTIDALNPTNAPDGMSAGDLVIAFSPLYHLPSGNMDFVVGPKLGFRANAITTPNGDAENTSTATGSVLGLNVGLFGAVSNGVSLGGLFSAEIRTVNRYCEKLAGLPEACTTDSELTGPSDKVIGLMGAALF